MQTTFAAAVGKITTVLESISEFGGDVYMTLGPDTATLPIMVYDVTDIGTAQDHANRGDFILTVSVTIQIWARTPDAALSLTDKLHQTLRAAKLVEARDNVFTISEEYTALDPSLPSGVMRVVSQYRLAV